MVPTLGNVQVLGSHHMNLRLELMIIAICDDAAVLRCVVSLSTYEAVKT